jgi:hypothetical protein
MISTQKSWSRENARHVIASLTPLAASILDPFHDPHLSDPPWFTCRRKLEQASHLGLDPGGRLCAATPRQSGRKS